LLAGDWAESLRANALAIPILALFAASLICLAWQGAHGRRLALPRWAGWTWAIVLLLAWILKLCGDPQYW
jgi:hypothetical protein